MHDDFEFVSISIKTNLLQREGDLLKGIWSGVFYHFCQQHSGGVKIFVSVRLQLVGAGRSGERANLQIQSAGITHILDSSAEGLPI